MPHRVITTDGPLSATDPHLLDNLFDGTWRYLSHLLGDDAVGKDDYGDAQLDLSDVPTTTVWTCLTCGYASHQHRSDRDTEHLRYDGAHYPHWHTDDHWHTDEQTGETHA
jgi:hypothetical protein